MLSGLARAKRWNRDCVTRLKIQQFTGQHCALRPMPCKRYVSRAEGGRSWFLLWVWYPSKEESSKATKAEWAQAIPARVAYVHREAQSAPSVSIGSLGRVQEGQSQAMVRNHSEARGLPPASHFHSIAPLIRALAIRPQAVRSYLTLLHHIYCFVDHFTARE